jgi:zinc D-Ala-D-Ala carboxypeptidase
VEWKYFSEKELKCKGTGECHMDSAFMKKLVTLREEFNKPIILTSAYRSPTYNIRIGGAENSPHVFGRAVDIQCLGSEAYEIIRLGIKHEMTGIGVAQRGNRVSRFIHLDDMVNTDIHRRPWIWSYK